VTIDNQDIREWQRLARGLLELGLDPGEYTLEVAAVDAGTAPGLAFGAMPRKAVAVKHRGGATFRHETYVGGAWAGEILQAVLARKATGDL
jgi:hypothetical protein